jgi:DNA-binding winged helix-turn-helix (wHTH) protein
MRLPLTDARAAHQLRHREIRREISPVTRELRPGATGAMLEFGRFSVLLRQRQLLAEDIPVELGTRAFDLLLVLLEADGLLVSKEDLLHRVWPGIVVAEENLKVQISALRKALGADRDLIRTEFGRGYRFTGVFRSSAAPNACYHAMRRRQWSAQRQFAQSCRYPFRGRCALSLNKPSEKR